LWRSISLLSNICLILSYLFLIYFNFGIGNTTSTCVWDLSIHWRSPPSPSTRYRQLYFYFVLQVFFNDTLYFLLKYVLLPVLFTLTQVVLLLITSTFTRVQIQSNLGTTGRRCFGMPYSHSGINAMSNGASSLLALSPVFSSSLSNTRSVMWAECVLSVGRVLFLVNGLYFLTL
jgi:hypothetical protein